jgi:Mlc titration factor MtfA (ptsG expression regulator)
MAGWWRRSRSSDDQDRVDASSAATAALLARRLPLWNHFLPDDRDLLAALVEQFVEARRWEAANGFTVTSEMQVLIAAQACQLLLGFRDELAAGTDPFDGVSSVIVHPSTLVVTGEHAAGAGGLVSDSPRPLLGEAHLRGPVMLSWQAVASDLAHPLRRRNVVVHEFAHQLDMLDGIVDGMPPLPDEAARLRWTDVCGRLHRAVRAGRGPELLDPYAGTDPVEFFAVASELMFTRPDLLRADIPDLYEVLVGFYRHDLAELVQPGGPPDGQISNR